MFLEAVQGVEDFAASKESVTVLPRSFRQVVCSGRGSSCPEEARTSRERREVFLFRRPFAFFFSLIRFEVKATGGGERKGSSGDCNDGADQVWAGGRGGGADEAETEVKG